MKNKGKLSLERYTEEARRLCPIYTVIGLEAKSLIDNVYKCYTPLCDYTKNHLNIMHAGPIWMTAEYLGGLVVMHNCESSQFQPVVANLEINFIKPANSGIYGELEFDEIAVRALRQDLESSGQHKFETKVIIRDEAEQIIAKAQGIYVVRNFLDAV